MKKQTMRILTILSILPVLASCCCPLKAQTDNYFPGDENYTGILDDINEWNGEPASRENTRWTGVLVKRDALVIGV